MSKITPMDKQTKQKQTNKLIALYRQRELLWNRNSALYRRNDLKKIAFKEIARECNMTEEFARKKLKALRGTYLLEKKKVRKSKESGCDDVYEPALSWYNSMSFLDATIDSRTPKKDVSNDTQDVTCDVAEATTSKYIESDVSCTPATPRKIKFEEINTDKFDEAINKIVNSNKIPTADAFSYFADSMAFTLRSMPEQMAYRTMTEIQELLFQRKFNTEEDYVI